LQIHSAGRPAITRTVRVSDTGTFSCEGKLRRPGVYRIHASSAGDDTHQDSHDDRKIRVQRARR
jgi:hypothetical protein